MQKMKRIAYKTDNMILQHLERTTSDVAVIVGLGHTIALDESNNITFSDPLFSPPKQNKNYGNCNVFMYYYTLGGEGLEAAGEDLTWYINRNCTHYRKIILHGHSKSGLDFLSIAGRDTLKRKVTVVSVSAPLRGTPVANWEYFKEILETKVERYIYEKIFSNHSVDKDITMISDFIKKLDLKTAISKHECHIIVSKCGESLNPVDWILGWIDKRWMIDGDGIVPLYCQKTERCIPYTKITASHATSLQRSCKYVIKLIQLL